MEELVHDGMTIGVAWGPAVYETVSSLRPGISSGVHVVQLIGAIGALDSQYFSPDIARRLARTLTGFYTPLPAPLFVDSEATREIPCCATRRFAPWSSSSRPSTWC